MKIFRGLVSPYDTRPAPRTRSLNPFYKERNIPPKDVKKDEKELILGPRPAPGLNKVMGPQERIEGSVASVLSLLI